MEETKKKDKKRKRKLWSSDDDELLLEIWDEKIDDLRGSRKTNPIYQEMSEELRNVRGSSFTAEEVRIKIHNLTGRYRKEKQKNVSGIPSDWPPFQKIHHILGGFNASKEEFLIDDTFEAISYESECKQEKETSEPETPLTPCISDASVAESPSKRFRGRPVKKKRPDTVFDSLLKEYRQTNLTIIEERNHVRKIDLEMLEIERERNEILKEFVSNAKVFQENVTRILQKIK